MRPDDLMPKTGEIIVHIRFLNNDEGLATWADLEEYIHNRLLSIPFSPFTTAPHSFEVVAEGVGPGRRYANVWQNVMDDGESA